MYLFSRLRGVASNLRFADLATKERREEAVKQLSGLEGEEAGWILRTLEAHEGRLAELGKRMEEERKGDDQIKRLE